MAMNKPRHHRRVWYLMELISETVKGTVSSKDFRDKKSKNSNIRAKKRSISF